MSFFSCKTSHPGNAFLFSKFEIFKKFGFVQSLTLEVWFDSSLTFESSIWLEFEKSGFKSISSYGPPIQKTWIFKKNMLKDEAKLFLLHKSPHIRENYGKYFLLLLLVGSTFSSMLQEFFAFSREGQYFYQDIAYCKYCGLALSFAKTKSSILGST